MNFLYQIANISAVTSILLATTVVAEPNFSVYFATPGYVDAFIDDQVLGIPEKWETAVGIKSSKVKAEIYRIGTKKFYPINDKKIFGDFGDGDFFDADLKPGQTVKLYFYDFDHNPILQATVKAEAGKTIHLIMDPFKKKLTTDNSIFKSDTGFSLNTNIKSSQIKIDPSIVITDPNSLMCKAEKERMKYTWCR